MPIDTQFLSSRRGVCSGLIVVMAILFLVLLSSSLGSGTNTSFVELGKNVHVQGLENSNSLSGLAAHGGESGEVIHGGASSFIYLTDGTASVLQWALELGLLAVFVLAVMERSYAMLIGPGVVTLVAMGLFDGDLWTKMEASLPNEAAIGMAVGVAVMLGLVRWRPTAIRRTPDLIPADPRARAETLQ